MNAVTGFSHGIAPTPDDYIHAFLDAMAAAGIVCRETIIDDGELKRFHVENDRKGSKNGWYFLHTNGKPNGKFGSWKFGISQKWSPEGSEPLTPEERGKMRAEWQAKRKQEAERRQADYQAAAERSIKMLDESVDATDDHPYLIKKRVKSYGLKRGTWVRRLGPDPRDEIVIENALLVPVCYGKKLRSLQAIFPSKENRLGRDKDFLPGGQKHGLWYSFGAPAGAKPPLLAVCEGYATAASVHECTGLPVVAAFDAGNLLPVGQALRTLLPQSRLLFCADDDREVKTPINNPGVTKAAEAAEKTGGLLVIPKFQSLDGNPTDFNDLHVREGADVVKAQIDAALNPGAPPANAGTVAAEIEPAGEWSDYRSHFTLLGYDGDTHYIMPAEKKQSVGYKSSNISEGHLSDICDINWWSSKFSGDKGVNVKEAANWLRRKSHKVGIFDPSRIRGRGCWHDNGRIVFNLGDRLLVDGTYVDLTALKSKFIYQAGRPMEPIASEPLSDADGRRIYDLAHMFRWEKKSSAILLAGWVALAPICGALGWRPHIWITGGAGAGKSTVLKDFVNHLCNGTALYCEGSTTEAGIRQELRGDARPVIFDEAEQNNEREKNRMQAAIALARQSSTESEAKTYKGTAAGDAMSFHIRSMFLFASIQVVTKHQADDERIAVLQLREKDDTDETAAMDWEKISTNIQVIKADDALRARLMRRSIDLLPITLKNINTFVTVGARVLGSPRAGDQIGTLLAGAWSLLSREEATEEVAEKLFESYGWKQIYLPQDGEDDSARALHALTTAPVRADKHGDIPVHELARRANGGTVPEGTDMSPKQANTFLNRHGLSVGREKNDDNANALLVDTGHPQLVKLFAGTPFTDVKRLLERLPDVHRTGQNNRIYIGGHRSSALVISLDMVLDPTGDTARADDVATQYKPAAGIGAVQEEDRPF